MAKYESISIEGQMASKASGLDDYCRSLKPLRFLEGGILCQAMWHLAANHLLINGVPDGPLRRELRDN